ncbi:SDR family oxidoreductase [Mycobacterium terramassiliense]|uniref:NAD(P)-dependent dehydrogenase, short-chain alcohol dehydrogenase family n=1 Tax=Mycobacterium terramassiliense TaxID=1841859 RepID=A0A2U3NB21_9MYCO|nr:SDR family oxidoreductase [Mycobacterium terramassiliense]SPM28690.1 NAD(P)-dependent dehydrogenase, short-chain alcohol dehydrogenase family [Mycobacterium terramassiliense]
MDKPICLITGATDGIGKVTAAALAREGYTVVLAARSEAKAAAVTSEIVAATGNRDVDYLTADLRSLSQLHRLADAFTARHPRLDVLLNNAGVVMPRRELTEDGYETTFQVNYLAHFYLTQLLLGALEASPQGRVINLSSSVYRAGKFEPDNLQGERRFSTIGAYAASKLCVLLFTIELAQRLGPARVTANAVHPGVVRTPMMRGAEGIFRAISYAALPFSRSAEKGAATSVFLAGSPDASRVSGQYFANAKPKKVKTAHNTPENRDRLWNLSMDACRL